MTKREREEQAAKAFYDFTGEEAGEVIEIETPDHDTHYMLGEVEAIAYNARRDGKRNSYIHEFKKSARPILSASHDGKALYILDGGYTVTDHGIEDTHMGMVALVNPSPRKKGKGRKMAAKKSRKYRTAAQRRATAKLIAFNKARRHGRAAPRKAHKTARKRHHVKSYSYTRKGKRVHVRSHMSNPTPRRRARRRNPIGGMLGKEFWMGEVLPTAVGGIAALGLDVAIGYLPLPAIVQTNSTVRSATKIVGALGLGWLASMATNKRTGEEVAAGAIAVTLYDMVKGYLVNNFPNLPIVPAATVVIPTAATTQSGAAGIGWTSPAPSMGSFLSDANLPVINPAHGLPYRSAVGETEADYIPGEQQSYMGSFVNAY